MTWSKVVSTRFQRENKHSTSQFRLELDCTHDTLPAFCALLSFISDFCCVSSTTEMLWETYALIKAQFYSSVSVLRREAYIYPTQNVPLPRYMSSAASDTCSPFNPTCNIRITKWLLGEGYPSLPSIRTPFKDPPVNFYITGVSTNRKKIEYPSSKQNQVRECRLQVS